MLLPRSAPRSQQVDSRQVSALLDRLDERSVEVHSIMVVRHGHVVAEGWWEPYSAGRPHLLYSLTKSFTAVAVGLAVADGLLALDDRVVDVLPDRVPAGLSERARSLTVHHLLSMTTGHRDDTLLAAWTLEPNDLVRGFLRVPAPDPPGSRHAYNNPTSYVLARMVERVTGRSLPELLDERLFRPVGIEGAEWDRLGDGSVFGFHGLHLTTEAVAAFGELLLRGGRWRDRQLVPREWLELATRRQVATEQNEDGTRTADWLQGYGYHFWHSRHGYRGDGAYGQYCLVVPEHDLVVAMTSATTDMQAPLDAVWDCLLPGLDTTGSPAADEALAHRLRRLALPVPPTGSTRPTRPARLAGPAGSGPVLDHVAVDGAVGEPALADGAEVTVWPVGWGWRVRVEVGGDAFEVEVGAGSWRESAPLGRPVVAAGGWQGDAFVADLCVVTTPHRVRLRVAPDGAVATWHTVPMTGPDLVRQLRAPLMTRPDVR